MDIRRSYRKLRSHSQSIRVMLRDGRYRAVSFLASDLSRFVLQQCGVEGQTLERAKAAAYWIFRAHDATDDGGVSYGYFPGRGGWLSSYPETTGYIIPTLLKFSERFNNEEARTRAIRMAEWEIAVQMPSGAAQGGRVTNSQEQTPAVFNTGMVLHGFASVFESTRDTRFLAAGQRAADFLLSDLKEDGTFRTHGRFVGENTIKTYESLCGWPLFMLGTSANNRSYHDAAIRAVMGGIDQQLPNGWFANNCLEQPFAPLLHTIGYTLQGILEVGVLSGREEFTEAAQRGAEPLLRHIHSSGFVPGRFRSDWEPASRSECLTGSAQLAIVCYRLAQETSDPHYRKAGDRIVNHLKAIQRANSSDSGINGALAGSFPFMGEYITAGFPNWATKYFLDALMLQAEFDT